MSLSYITEFAAQQNVSLEAVQQYLDPNYHNIPLLVDWWTWMTTTFSETALYSWVLWIAVVGSYLLASAFYGVFDYMKWAQQYKIQPKRQPTYAQYKHCFLQVMANFCFIVFPLGFVNQPILKFVGVNASMDGFPSLKTMAWQVFVFFIVEDIVQYILHRALHWGILYQYIHKVHHHHPAPFGLTSSYAHWAEILILAIPTYTGPVVFGCHLSTMFVWLILRDLDSIHTHCGYEFPFQAWANKIPFYGGAQFHDYHHYAFNCNYASRITLIDKICGTYREATVHKPAKTIKAKSK